VSPFDSAQVLIADHSEKMTSNFPMAKPVMEATVWIGVPPAGTDTLPRLNPVVFAGTQIMLIESPDTALRHLASGSSGWNSQNLPQLLLQLVGTKATGKSKNTNPTERIAPKSVYPQACRTRFHQTCGNENQKNIPSNQRNMKPTALRPNAAQE